MLQDASGVQLLPCFITLSGSSSLTGIVCATCCSISHSAFSYFCRVTPHNSPDQRVVVLLDDPHFLSSWHGHFLFSPVHMFLVLSVRGVSLALVCLMSSSCSLLQCCGHVLYKIFWFFTTMSHLRRASVAPLQVGCVLFKLPCTLVFFRFRTSACFAWPLNLHFRRNVSFGPGTTVICCFALCRCHCSVFRHLFFFDFFVALISPSVVTLILNPLVSGNPRFRNYLSSCLRAISLQCAVGSSGTAATGSITVALLQLFSMPVQARRHPYP